MSATTSDGRMGSPDGEIEAAVASAVPSICPTIDSADDESGERSDEQDPFAGGAEDIAANETRRKIELFTWADGVLGLNDADLELALEDAVKHFNMTRRALKQIIKARRADKAKAEARAERSRAEPDDGKDNVKYYSRDFKVSDRGVFARKIDDKGHPFWDRICTTRIDPAALTRDAREENWGTYIILTNRDGGKKKLAVPHALIHADKVADIAGLLFAARNHSIASGPSTPRAVPHARYKWAYNCRASDRLALQRRHLAICAARRHHRACRI